MISLITKSNCSPRSSLQVGNPRTYRPTEPHSKFPTLSSSRSPMSARYAPLPTQRPSEHSDDELDVAFDGSDDELDYDDDNAPVSESQPLDPSRSVHTSPPLSARNHPPSISIPGAYDFERVDYDVPPPGSPPERRRTITGTPMASFPRLIPT